RWRKAIFFVFPGSTCAFDIVLKSESQMNVYFDVSNGAIKNEFRPLSPGSILMWLNISRARHYSLQYKEYAQTEGDAVD
ncbi:hypothetical protein O7N81_004404, partial [Salmonella enterica]|nr:hypothetical protein [Salmonella enterica]